MSRFDKYKDKPPQFCSNGETFAAGGFEEMLCHAKWQFHRYLEDVINDPHKPNPLEVAQEPEFRKLLKEHGLIELTQSQIYFKASKYFDRLAAGEEPYSDKFHPPATWQESDLAPVTVLINNKTGDWMQTPTVVDKSVTDTQQQQQQQQQ